MRATVRNDVRAKQRLGDDPDAEAAYAVLTAAFELVMRRRFTPGQDVRDIAAFVNGVKNRYALEMVRPIDAEALIRAALGEEVSIDGIDARREFHMRMFTFVDAVEQLRLSRRDLDALLFEAEQIATTRGYAPAPAPP